MRMERRSALDTWREVTADFNELLQCLSRKETAVKWFIKVIDNVIVNCSCEEINPRLEKKPES